MPHRLLLLTTLALPAAGALLLQAYLHNAPLSAKKTSTISILPTLSPTALISPSHKTINPRSLTHNSATDSRYIILSHSEIRNLTDEQILSRFLRGFYNGWVFWLERGVIEAFRAVGRTMVRVGFTGLETNGREILRPRDIGKERLPEKGTVLLGGNFVVLGKDVRAEEKGPSFVEIGFGDDRKGFAGFHRFEVERLREKEGEEGMRLWYSSISCHPREDRLPLPGWLYIFHNFYAQCLFRDGVREVLSN
ncbi:hypothetical protein L207DRAFT_589399 [Hyaloscypha variabilis F]|uniref:Uncharacterized protein n=1 Tax=Hyaloscypha variabilis (strain UAMH 11265 / GT02V1 / F) TaxID=1149755 RepID=A0A2J6R5T1_HYAVF|nr:hypothetical protein L207DRAFT_589399 [Hyaloscypha variabilis F]